MLEIIIPEAELYDEKTNRFVSVKETKIEIEHSLAAVSKWESKWHKPFLQSNKTQDEKTYEELIDYVRCATLTENVDPLIFSNLSEDNLKKIADYMNDKMTATWFSEDKSKKATSREVVTSEIIYYWMVSLNIPFECQYWHLNKLLTLIRVCDEKNQPSKKMSKRDVMKRNKALNASRRKAHHTRG